MKKIDMNLEEQTENCSFYMKIYGVLSIVGVGVIALAYGLIFGVYDKFDRLLELLQRKNTLLTSNEALQFLILFTSIIFVCTLCSGIGFIIASYKPQKWKLVFAMGTIYLIEIAALLIIEHIYNLGGLFPVSAMGLPTILLVFYAGFIYRKAYLKSLEPNAGEQQ